MTESDDDGVEIAMSSYAGCHHDVEAPIAEDNHGVLFLNSHVQYSDITDGSSKTILVGEHLIQSGSLGWVSGTRATLRNTGSLDELGGRYGRAAARDLDEPGNQSDEVTAEGAREQDELLRVGGFGGPHHATNFVFADGSARALTGQIDPEVFRRLGHRADGELLSATEY